MLWYAIKFRVAEEYGTHTFPWKIAPLRDSQECSAPSGKYVFDRDTLVTITVCGAACVSLAAGAEAIAARCTGLSRLERFRMMLEFIKQTGFQRARGSLAWSGAAPLRAKDF